MLRARCPPHPLQDQMGVVKRRLSSLLPGLKIFLGAAGAFEYTCTQTNMHTHIRQRLRISARFLKLAPPTCVSLLIRRRRSARNQRPRIACRSVGMRPYFHFPWLLVRLDEQPSHALPAGLDVGLTFKRPAIRSYSVNCCREAQAVTDKRKPIILLREANMAKGGISIADSMLECEKRPDVRDYIFTGQQVVTWMRIQEHQLESLRQVAIGVLLTTPKYATLQQQAMQTLDLHIPREVRLQRLRLPRPVRLCCSSANPGANGVADELCDRLGRENVTVTIEDADSIPNGRLGRRKSSQGAILSSFFRSQTNTFLLYLNSTTWDSADPDRREALAGHVTRARDRGESLLMVHEADLTRGGCEFGIFFQLVSATPTLATHTKLAGVH